MSYGFNGRCATKEQAKAFVATELDKVVAGQAMHAQECPAVQAAANAFIDVLAVPDGGSIDVSVSGSVGWNVPLSGPGENHPLTAAAVSINVYAIAAVAAV